MHSSLTSLKQTLIYKEQNTADQILLRVAELQESDKLHEKHQLRGLLLMLGGVAVAGGGLLAAGAENVLLAGALLFLGLALLVFGIITRMDASGGNLPDQRYELLWAVVQMLRCDMAKDAPIDVWLSFRSPTDGDKLQGKGKLGPWNVSYFDDPWFRLQGRLIDGTAFRLAVSELTQKRSGWRRGRSGKQKYKTKTKSRTVAELQLRPKLSKYPGWQQLAGPLSSVNVPSWCEAKRAEVTPKAMVLKAVTKLPWEVKLAGRRPRRDLVCGRELVASLFLNLHGALQKSQTAANPPELN